MIDPVRVIFLGGLGEVGRNMFAVEVGGHALVIDCGLSFPTEEMLGVDLVLPDWRYLIEGESVVEGVILTHGHEDHVGALSWFLKDVDAPVYGTPLTLGLARRRLDEWGVTDAELIEVSAPGSRTIGPFRCRFFAMSHSIPDAVSVVIDTPEGRIFYTSDFKLDETPIDGRRTDLVGLAAVGEEGIDLMLSDSTNAEHPGRTPSEAVVGEGLRELFEGAEARIVIACFASNLHRIQQVCETAEAFGRHVALAGRSMIANVEVGRALGHIKVAPSTLVALEDAMKLPRERVVIICTGSQGEPLSALSLIAAGEHKTIRIEPGDSVILSASPIPGNESAVHRVINALFKAGAFVFHPPNYPVHVSGHGGADELLEVAMLVRPRHLVPVHGEYRQLAAHRRIAEAAGVSGDSITIVEDGDVLELRRGRVTKGEPVPSGTILVDGLGVGDVGPVVLRDRRVLADDGIVICVVTIDGHSGEVLAGPDLITRGFVHEDERRDFLDRAADRAAAALESLETEHSTDWGAIKKACRRAVGEFVWKETRRRPMILPVVMEV